MNNVQMSKYNFKEFFTNKSLYSDELIHNNEYASNTHFLIKKSELKKNQLEFVNNFPVADQNYNNQFSQILNSQLKMDIETEFKPEKIHIKYNNNTIAMNKTAIKESYFNFIQSLNCKLFIVKSDKEFNLLSIYNNNDEFVGVVSPFRLDRVQMNQFIIYNEYLEQQKVEQESKELSKQNSKKCLYIKDNKAIVRNKELISIAKLTNNEAYKNLYIERCIQENKDAEIYFDLGIVCIYVRTLQTSYNENKSIDYDYYISYLKDNNFTLDRALEDIQNKRINNQFVNVADIKLIELNGASKQEVQELIDYRQVWYDRKAKEEQEKNEKREQVNREYVETKNKIVEEAITQAEQAILNKQEIKNKDVTIYKSRYESNDTSLILHMMKLYRIKVPLKTQGWINQALATIQYNEEWEDYSYRFYNTSANSTVFNKYLGQLIKAIQNKHVEAITT